MKLDKRFWTLFGINFVIIGGAKIYALYQDRQWQKSLDETYRKYQDKIVGETEDLPDEDQIEQMGTYFDLDDEDLPEGTVAVLQPVQDWFAGSNTNAEFLNDDEVTWLSQMSVASEQGDIMVPQTMFCAYADTCDFHRGMTDTCDFHRGMTPEVTEKYQRTGLGTEVIPPTAGAPQHSAVAKEHRERVAQTEEVSDVPGAFRGVVVATAELMDEHEYCYDLQRRGAGASTCIVDGDQPQDCPHYDAYDTTEPPEA